MSSVRIEIKNLDKLTSLASKFPKISQKHIDQAIVRSIGEIDIQTKPITPVKTARLRNSMIPIFRPFRGVYGSGIPYATEVHDRYSPGTSYRRPSLNKSAVAGFLTVGVKRATEKIQTIMQEALKKIVEDLAK